MVASHADVDVIGGTDEREVLGGLIGISLGSTVIASYAAGDIDGSTANTNHDTGFYDTQFGGGLIGNVYDNSRIIASYASGTVTILPSSTNFTQNLYYGGLVGFLRGTPVSASYSAGDVNVSGGRVPLIRYAVGGFVGNQASTSAVLSATYSSGDITANVSMGNDTAWPVGKLVGVPGTDVDNSFRRASYGFGTITGIERTITPLPTGISTATGLNADNVQSCSNPVYTTQSACESTSLTITPGVWSTTLRACSAPVSDATDGVDYTAITAQTDCEAPAKTTAYVWTSWNSANDRTLNAWVFESGAAPKLRYADYDGAGTVVNCDMFPAIIPGTDTPLVCGVNGSELGGQ